MPDKDKSEFVSTASDRGMVKRQRQPLFEREIISPGVDLHEAITKTYFETEDMVNKAARYFSHMQKFNKNGKMDRQINAGLMKINGNKAIGARFMKLGVQAHGGLFWDSDASKEDKKYLAKLQEKDRRDDGRNGHERERE